MRNNLSIEEFCEIVNFNLIPDEWTDVPDWLDENNTEIAAYMASQLGARIILKKYDPDDDIPFFSWYEMQLFSFMTAHDYEYTKKYELMQEAYTFNADRSYNKNGNNTFTPGTTTTFSHTNDKSTHSERTYDSDTITPISSDERTGSSSTSLSGNDQNYYHEGLEETRNPQDAIEAERRIANYSFIIEAATDFVNAITYANWEV